ncbi:adenylate/guanylate cyclase domain-containing protein [Isosphaeraceae bacterium EP7]
MKDSLEIRVYDAQVPVYQGEFVKPVELGRQGAGEEGPYSKVGRSGRYRLIVAGLEESNVSRRHVLLEPLGDGWARLTNLSSHAPLRIEGRGDLRPQSAPLDLPLPFVFFLGRKAVRAQAPEVEEVGVINALAEATMIPGGGASPRPKPSILSRPAAPSSDLESMVRWLSATMNVLLSGGNAGEFFQQAAQAIVDVAGLDTGRVLLLDDGDWKTVAVGISPAMLQARPDFQPSRSVTRKVLAEKRTFWQIPDSDSSASLEGLESVIAAPILDCNGEVIGIVYGERGASCSSDDEDAISILDAMLVELLASGVANSLARREQEVAVVAARVRFEQFFTPELSRELEAHPDLLSGRDSEVTLLFADIRGFSHLSERLGPTRTVDLINDVMSALSDCVLEHQGVLVDYIGDELMAMWGAPCAQPEHAKLACKAALDMLGQLPAINGRWQGTAGIDREIGLGIGLNTGIARVGNTGSTKKFKYGPLGNTVNLASRVQGATKHLRTRLLVTGMTQAGVGDDFAVRRLGKVRVVNIQAPVDLYEIDSGTTPNWSRLKHEYEAALVHFERGELAPAARILGALQFEFAGDGPSLVLLSRVVNAMVDPSKYDPIMELPGK